MPLRFSKTLLIAAAVAVLGGGAALWAATGRPVEVSTAPAEVAAMAPVYGLGTVEARVLSKLAFEATGTLASVHADQWDRVAAGTVLAQLDPREQAARLARAEAQLRQAEAAQVQAKARLDRAQAVEAQKHSSNRRRQALARSGTVSPETAEEALAEAQVAVAETAVARSDVAAAAAATESAAAQVAQEREALAKLALKAPYDALVVERSREPGSVVAPGNPVFTVIDPESVWVRAYVDEAVAGSLAVGQTAEILLRSRPGAPLPGRVARIDVENDRVSEERIVHVAFRELPAEFHLGEQAEVTITAEPGGGVLLPPQAVDEIRGRSGVVWVVEDGRLQRREVRVGRRFADGSIEVLQGVAAADRVVTRPGERLRDGARVAEAS